VCSSDLNKLKVKCPENHIYKVLYGNFQKGRRCPICKIGGKLQYSYIKKQIEKIEGYKLLSKTYKNCLTKIKVQCNKGHEYKVKWNDFQTRYRCPICAGNKKHTLKYVKEQIERVKGYKLLSKSYKNNSTNLDIQCNKGHIYKVTWNNFQRGYRCSKCCLNYSRI